MKAISQFSALLLLFFTVRCSGHEPIPNTYGLAGEWRFYEEGGSPGFGYFITPIPAIPLQKLTFLPDGRLLKQGDRLSGFFEAPYYRVDSTAATGRRLYFLASPKASSTYSVAFRLKGDTLRITPQCYEGCHYGFVRIR